MSWPLATTTEDDVTTNLKTALDEKRAEAQRLWADFDETRERVKGSEALRDVTSEAFKTLEAKRAAYTPVAEQAEELRERWERAVQGPASRTGFGSDSVGKAFLTRLGASQAGLKALDGTSGGTLVPPFFDGRIRELPTRQLFVRSIIPVTPATSDKVWYLRQSVHTNAAAPVVAGGLKPTSIYTIERIEETVRTIAHVTEALDRALLSDYEELVSFIDGQLRLGVLLAEENQLINGSGTAPNLRGILNTAGIGTVARGTDSRADAVHKAVTTCRLSYYEPDAIVLHPTDFQTIRLEKAASGDYLAGPIVQDGPDTLWGKQVITSPVIALGTGLVGAFAAGSVFYDREEARVTFTESGLGDTAGQELFTRNLIRFRGEERVAFGVSRPQAFTSVTGL